MNRIKTKIIFSAEIDSKIAGIAFVLAFLSTGLFLLFFPNYFGNKLASDIIRWIFIIIGVLGLISEFPKSKNNNIKGFDNLIIGAILIGLWIFLFLYINNIWVNIISFILLLLGSYGLYLGLIQISYSSIKAINTKKETKKSVLTDIILLLTKIASLILVIIQTIKAITI